MQCPCHEECGRPHKAHNMATLGPRAARDMPAQCAHHVSELPKQCPLDKSTPYPAIARWARDAGNQRSQGTGRCPQSAHILQDLARNRLTVYARSLVDRQTRL